ncbi:3-hydroxyisobutyrate dehydrogenase, partial [Culex quinquefasciatus]
MAFRVMSINSLKQATLLGELLARSFSTGPKNIGFIGLGNMGGPMASNLMAKV